ncbi:flagellar motor switch protein FliG [Polynucleobacter sp. AP-Feld-500C-C5]|uniref:flagellar motor switch protein FliG n=1 Tax=Polynucleobacter sp. AP-Feld-500C-C5 TaxID=2576924 RepID=UPI001C0CFE83|nr:flagellar motor switch protein FliG [Polynucleobacter sp. AP-Feld-500C-C5]MBU3633153.1 flagellar motor switch protein FliG [Polynucleobacter sp. AP-Feld-500C-C5]
MAQENSILKAAILMLALGEEGASMVMKHVSPRDVQKLSTVMTTLRKVDQSAVAETLRDFFSFAGEGASLNIDTDSFTRNVLTQALGQETAAGLFERILENQDSEGIENLKWMDASAVADLIRYEHPQIIATILVHLEPEQSSQILSLFNEDLRKDTMLRIATLEEIKPQALKELNVVLARLLSGAQTSAKKQIGGIRAAAEIMNYIGQAPQQVLMDRIKEYDIDIAEKINDEMFTFDDIIGIDDRGIQTILRDVQSDALIVALKGANAELREKILKNMSTRAADMMREDLENRGPVKLSEVEAQQKEILVVVRGLIEDGSVMLPGKGGGEDYV